MGSTRADLAVGDGALGFWAALAEIFPTTRQQRCWVHKTANVLNYLPKSLQAHAKAGLHDIWMADTKANAETAFDRFVSNSDAKYPKATACLAKDRAVLLRSLRVSGRALDSHSQQQRHRVRELRHHSPPDQPREGCVAREEIFAMIFKLGQSAERSWRRLRGFECIGKVVVGVTAERWDRSENGTTCQTEKSTRETAPDDYASRRFNGITELINQAGE